jgi:acyl-coenzyme A synthetase/AMP-(fatty) acid ligase
LPKTPERLPLLPGFAPHRTLFVTGSATAPLAVSHRAFLAQAAALARALPHAPYLLNLCSDRYAFALAFAAGLIRGAVSLFPPNRLAATIEDIARDYPGARCVTDTPVPGLALPCFTLDAAVIASDPTPAEAPAMPMIPAERESFIAFTSGSTGRPRPHPKHWGDLVGCARAAARRFGFGPALGFVATVPPQHMYGLELSILVPFVTGAQVAASRPFFPDDIRAALAMMPPPRALVTTPVHLRACLDADLDWPALDLVISATAPLPTALATAVETALATRVCEIYGSTETGSIASRTTSIDPLWRWYDGVHPAGDGDDVRIRADFVHGTVPLADVLERTADGGFRLLGRAADMVKVGGKRASLADLNLKLNAVEGVQDGVFVTPDPDAERVTRLAAVVVAPGLDRQAIIAALAGHIDPVFYPRQVALVEQLPRNEAGKLTRAALLEVLARATGKPPDGPAGARTPSGGPQHDTETPDAG